MRFFGEIGLFDSHKNLNFENMTYRQLTASLIGVQEKMDKEIEKKTATFLNLDKNSDFIHRLKWLGFFDDTPIHIKTGSRSDVLLERMLTKMSYLPHEKDMIIVHIEIIAKFPGKPEEERSATMIKKGIPYGDSAMSRAVGLPVAIGSQMILEGKITSVGAHIPPTLPQIYPHLLKELEKFGFVFKKELISNESVV
jgi:saccharopine dehydrogenase (NADP+, L-glutamate forming)